MPCLPNMQKYNLPFAEAVFDIGFYRKNPEPFVQLAGQLWPGISHSPTLTHSFISLLQQKKMLLRDYTQVEDFGREGLSSYVIAKL